jgi:hypothetical protein
MGKVGGKWEGLAVLNVESFNRLRINFLDLCCGTSMRGFFSKGEEW